MVTSEERAEQTEALRAKIDALESEAKFLRTQILRLSESLERQEQLLRSQQASLARVDRIQMQMLTGRLWRTLRAASDLAKRFLPIRGAANEEDSVAQSPKLSYLVCDEPKAGSQEPRSGMIVVRGWCLAEGGVDSVRISIPGMLQLDVQPSIARPDVKKAHPTLDTTGRAGFLTEIDSSRLPNGRYPVKVQVISKGESVREARTSVLIDHENGFADDYDRWIHQFEKPDDAHIGLWLGTCSVHPLISVLMPVFNPQPGDLNAAIHSVIDQSYENWELCIANDASTDPEVEAILEDAASRDTRIRVFNRDRQGGIAAACNTAWAGASGDFLTFLDHDDTLSPHAFAYVLQAVNNQPNADLLYSDEDKLDSRGRRFDPFFKPDWSPDLLLSENYVCHLLVLRRDLAARVGGFRSDCDGSQDYDLILQATAHAQEIVHIPRVLYHWRTGLTSTASTIENKSYAIDAARRALERVCQQRDPAVRIETGTITGRWRVRYPIAPDTRVSIIIASGGKEEILRNNINSIFQSAGFPGYEVVVIDNSKSSGIQQLVRSFAQAPRPVRYIDHRNQPFNYSTINNRAARECDSNILLFLNDDTSGISENWLEAMVELAARPEVGAVGAKLLYPEGNIQHAGVVMGLFDNCGHAFKGLDGSLAHYFDFSDVIRNVSAVTGACLMSRREVFWKAGGFDETDFAVAFNDVDLCLKIGAAGYRVLYTPHARLYHYEAFSKTSKDLIPHPAEVAKMRQKWRRVIQQDPFYSPNLTRNDEDYSLRKLT